MKGITNTILRACVSLGLIAALPPVSAYAEGLERPWKDPSAPKKKYPTGILNSLLPSKAKPVRRARPSPGTINIAQPKSPKKRTVKKRAAVKKKQPVRLQPVRLKSAAPVVTAQKSRTRKQAKQEAAWWEKVGNPVVFAFRDCSAGFARNQVRKGVKASPAALITKAMKTTCQVEFAKMAGVMIGGLGEKKSNAMLVELAKTTFLPTVKAAVAAESRIQVAKATQRAEKQSLGTAKVEMFRCFSKRTDHLLVAKNTPANVIADAVLTGCSKQSDAFFELLFANSKASRRVKLQQKNIALGETYKIAIIRRVLLSRKPAQVKTATQQ